MRFKDLAGSDVADGDGEIGLKVSGGGVVAGVGILRNHFQFLPKTHINYPMRSGDKPNVPDGYRLGGDMQRVARMSLVYKGHGVLKNVGGKE